MTHSGISADPSNCPMMLSSMCGFVCIDREEVLARERERGRREGAREGVAAEPKERSTLG